MSGLMRRMSTSLYGGSRGGDYESAKEGEAHGAEDESGKLDLDLDRAKIVEVEDTKEVWEEFRIRAKKFMTFSLFGRMYENLLIVTAVFSTCEFIATTYTYDITEEMSNIFQLVEIALAVIFSWDWMLCFLLADSKLSHLTSFYSMIDLLTVIPIWITQDYPCMDYNHIESSADAMIYILCAITSTRILRSLRIRRKLLRIEDEVSQVLADIALNIVVFMLFFAALMQFLEKTEAADVSDLSKRDSEEFHSWVYYVMVTMTTVGYGDISPKSTWGRILAMSVITCGFVAGPQMSSRLVEKMGEQSVFARARYVKKYKATHVFVCGDISTMAVWPFVSELFHEDHEDEDINAVFMSPDLPNAIMRKVLRDPVFSLRVTYLEGSVLSNADLKRALVPEALAIFIMANKFTSDPDEEDAKTVLQQFAMKKFIMQERLLEKPLFTMQLIRPENKRYLIDSTSIEGGESKDDIILCLNEIKMGIIAKAIMFPGSNTLLMNLLTSFADDDDDDDAEGEEDENKETENLGNDEGDNWVGEYQQGCGWEIYTTRLSPMFSGTTFAMLAEVLYQRVGVVLFGLLVEDLKKDKSQARMILNPADYAIPAPSDCYVEAFVIAMNKNSSDLTFDADENGEHATDSTSSSSAIEMATAAAKMGISLASAYAASGDKHHHQHRPLPHSPSGAGEARQEKHQQRQQQPKQELEWQQLLHKYEGKSPSSSLTNQELDRNVETEYMKSNFYTLLPNRALISSCTIRTSLAIEAPFVNQHTLILGKKLANLFEIIRPLRAAYLGYTRPIVIMTPDPIADAVWERISIFQGVYVIQGSLLEEHDILRAGALKAAQCIVLADNSNLSDDSNMTAGAQATMNALVDADAIFAFQTVKSMNPEINCCIEIINASNVTFLDPNEGLIRGDVDYKFSPQFASGILLTSSLLDTLICQAFYNRSLVSIIQLFVSGVEIKDKQTIREQLLAGVGGAAAPKKGVAAIVGSSLYQMKLPESESVRTYGELFKSLTAQGIVPLGLYRGVFKNMQVGPKQNKLPYVFTNPPKETELFSCDRVFVLSQKPIMGKRTLTKRSDWSLVHKIDDDPIEQLRKQLEAVHEGQSRRFQRIDDKLNDVFAAIDETFGRKR